MTRPADVRLALILAGLLALLPPGASAQWAETGVHERAAVRAPAPRSHGQPGHDHGPTSTCSKGLYAVESPAPGGGKVFNLQGRFQAVLRAYVGPDGSSSEECSGHAAPSSERAASQASEPSE